MRRGDHRSACLAIIRIIIRSAAAWPGFSERRQLSAAGASHRQGRTRQSLTEVRACKAGGGCEDDRAYFDCSATLRPSRRSVSWYSATRSKTFLSRIGKSDDQVSGLVQQMLKKNFRIKTITSSSGGFRKVQSREFLSSRALRTNCSSSSPDTRRAALRLLSARPACLPRRTTNQGLAAWACCAWEHFQLRPGICPRTYRLAASMAVTSPLRAEFDFDDQAHPDAGCAERTEPQDEGWRTAARRRKCRHRDARTRKIVWDLLKQSLAKTLPKLFATN